MNPNDALKGPHVECVCPFCGVAFYAYEAGGLVHRLPICPKFMALEPEDFLAAVNDEFQRRLGGMRS